MAMWDEVVRASLDRFTTDDSADGLIISTAKRYLPHDYGVWHVIHGRVFVTCVEINRVRRYELLAAEGESNLIFDSGELQ